MFFGIGMGFLVLYVTGWRRTGPETFGGPIWWRAYRPYHGLAYLAAGVCVTLGRYDWASFCLFVDVLLGVGLASGHYYALGDRGGCEK